MKNLPDGTACCSFSLAVRRAKKDSPPLWLQISTFGKQAEACKKFLAKGRPVAVVGALDIRNYAGRDGSAKTEVCIHASQVDFLGGNEPMAAPASAAEIDDSGIPF